MPADPSVTTVEPRPAGPGAALRVLVVTLLAAYIWLGPVPKQVFDHGHPGLRTWQMFSGAGLESTEVRFWQVRAGEKVPLTAEDLASAGIPAQKRGQAIDEKNAIAIARRVCQKLGPDADVRFSIRKAKRSGWGKREGGDQNRCEGLSPRRSGLEMRAEGRP